MFSRDSLIAWIEPRPSSDFVAAFVASATATQRRPAIRRFASRDEARDWVETQAAEFEVPVEWVDRGPVHAS
jgi:hypothetical protein